MTTQHRTGDGAATLPDGFVPLALEQRATLPTSIAAAHLNRAPQTLRIWASQECGPIRPVRIFGKLGWPTAEIRRLVGAQ